jgi:signal transduction histidine kinase
MTAVVHDFRTPLSVIKGYAALLGQHDLDPERRLGYSRLVSEEADRMGRLIEALLEFTRGERRPLELRVVDLQELTERTFELLWPQLESRGIAYSSRLDYGGPLEVDADQIRRAMLNIGANAIEAMPRGGRFTVSSRLAAGGMVELTLADTGCGIPAELQARVFEPFFTHGKPRGIGLGMAVARRIVEDHGGRIAVESRPGEGTRFTLSLPVKLPG